MRVHPLYFDLPKYQATVIKRGLLPRTWIVRADRDTLERAVPADCLELLRG